MSRYNVSLPRFAPDATGVVGSRFAISPAGDQLVYAGIAPQGNVTHLYVRDRNSLDGRPISGHGRGGSPRRFLSDGTRVAFLSGLAGTTVSVGSIDGGPSVVVADSGTDLMGHLLGAR